ncbi:MAG: hypothetical protein ACYSWP_23060 [Planctomycetota bacterium]|jgi:hypothetical protein
MSENEPDQYILKRKKKRRWIILAVLLSVLLVVGLFTLKIVLICTAKPTISINYAVELNRISKPLNYDPNHNAVFDYKRAANAFVDMPLEVLDLRKQPPEQLTDSQKMILNKWLKDNDEALPHIEHGSEKPYIWLKADFIGQGGWVVKLEIEDLKSRFSIEPITRLLEGLTWRSKLFTLQGKPDSAIQDLLTVHRVGVQLAYQHETRVIGWIMKYKAAKIAFELLAGNELDAELLAGFQNRLERQMHPSSLTLHFERERILTLDIIQRIFTDDGKGNGRLIPNDGAILMVREYLSWKEKQSPRSDGFLSKIFDFDKPPTERTARIESIQIAMFGPDRRQVTKGVNKYFDFIKTLADKRPWQLQQMDFEQKLQGFGAKPAKLMTCARYRLLRDFLMVQRFEMNVPPLVTTLAILRYDSDKGQPPENLQQLVDTGYLKTIPMDPYSSEPLVYKRRGNDFLLYSIDQDFKDDGGTKDDLIFWPVKKKQ